MIDLNKFEKTIGVNFNNINLLKQSLTHRSYLNENSKEKTEHNERMEFLGDAVLELSVTEYLYNNFSNPEGDLTAWRASLVNSKMLSAIAIEVSLNDFLFLSKGEEKDTGRARNYILANAFEALIGAIYLDQGYVAADQFIHKYIIPHLPNIIEQRLYQDSKSLFQEEAQEKEGVTPIYQVLDEWGPDHDKYFKVGVYIKEQLVAEGTGKAKQEAEQSAALAALKKMDW